MEKKKSFDRECESVRKQLISLTKTSNHKKAEWSQQHAETSQHHKQNIFMRKRKEKNTCTINRCQGKWKGSADFLIFFERTVKIKHENGGKM